MKKRWVSLLAALLVFAMLATGALAEYDDMTEFDDMEGFVEVEVEELEEFSISDEEPGEMEEFVLPVEEQGEVDLGFEDEDSMETGAYAEEEWLTSDVYDMVETYADDAMMASINEPSAEDKVFIYDQGYSGAHNIGGNISIVHNGSNKTMTSAGCSLYTYLHAYQWLTGDKRTSQNATDLINQFLSVSKNVKDDNAYASFLAQYGISKSTPGMNENSLFSHFGKGGVIKVYTPNGGRHFILAVGAVSADIDNNGNTETWIHIIDSAAYFTFNPNTGTVTNGCYSFSNKQPINLAVLNNNNGNGGSCTNRRSEDNYAALEYWMNYNVFKNCGIVVGYLPGSTPVFVPENYTEYRVTTTDGLNMRSSASTSGTYITTLWPDTTIKVTQKTSADGYTWGYGTSSNGYTGWVVVDNNWTAMVSSTAHTVPDTQAPTITDVQVYDITPSGYTVSCAVSDNVGVTKVAFPTWTLANDQDDLFNSWETTAVGSLNNGTATYRVETSKHNNETNCDYVTDIYAFDAAGNSTRSTTYLVFVPSAHTHSPVTVKGYAATCTKDGLTDGSKCSTCGEVLTAQKSIPAKGHSLQTVKGKAATCTAAGLTDGSKCSVCGEVLTAQKSIPAKGHSPQTVKGKATTCTAAGLTDGSKCSVCGEVLTAQKSIPATGHTPVYVAGYGATYDAPGMTDGSYCAVCGVTLVPQQVIPQLEWPARVLDRNKNNGTVTVNLGEKVRLVPQFAYAAGAEVTGFKSGKAKVAGVDGGGLVTALAEGKAKITVTTSNKKQKATITVVVVDPYKPMGIGIAQGKAITLTMGQPVQLGVGLNPATARATLTWKSNKAKVATVDGNGVVYPVGEGKAKITVTTHNKKKATIAVTVVDPYKPLGVSIAQGKTLTIKVNQTALLSATLNPASAQSALTWQSSKPSVVFVDSNGIIAGVKKGKAKITVTTYNKKKATITVNVVD